VLVVALLLFESFSSYNAMLVKSEKTLFASNHCIAFLSAAAVRFLLRVGVGSIPPSSQNFRGCRGTDRIPPFHPLQPWIDPLDCHGNDRIPPFHPFVATQLIVLSRIHFFHCRTVIAFVP